MLISVDIVGRTATCGISVSIVSVSCVDVVRGVVEVDEVKDDVAMDSLDWQSSASCGRWG